MPVTNVTHDIDTRTIVITAEFAAPHDRVWEVYANPRQLEKDLGPTHFPGDLHRAQFRPRWQGHLLHDQPGRGEVLGGWWEMVSIDKPNGFTFKDGFADAANDLQPVESMPVSFNDYRFTDNDGTTTALFTSVYETAEALQQVLDMGVIEGASSAINQIDELLASDHCSAG